MQPDGMTLLAGVGRCDITPAPGTPQGGWGAQTHVRGVAADRPLVATALALSDGMTQWLIVEADAIGFNREGTDHILDAIVDLTAVPRDRIRFSCSHTHSGPNTFRLANIADGLDMILSYLAALPGRIASAAWQALQVMEPVHVGVAVGECFINRNRRVRSPEGEVVVGVNEDEPSDSMLGVIRLDRRDGATLATLLHYACHPTTVGWQSDRFTPDFPGIARAVVEQELGGTCLFLQGAAGDLGPRRGFTGELAVYRGLGKELGLTAAGIAMGIDTQACQARFLSVMPSGANIAQYTYEASPGSVSCRMISRTLHLPIRSLPQEAELLPVLQQLRERVDVLRASGDTEQMARMQSKATQMGWRLENSRRYEGHATTEWPMQVMRLGPVALVSMAGEPFSSIAARIREQSPAKYTFVSGYSNGGFGYIPDRNAYRDGGYEVEATPFSADAADLVVAEALKAIHELFEEHTAQ